MDYFDEQSYGFAQIPKSVASGDRAKHVQLSRGLIAIGLMELSCFLFQLYESLNTTLEDYFAKVRNATEATLQIV